MKHLSALIIASLIAAHAHAQSTAQPVLTMEQPALVDTIPLDSAAGNTYYDLRFSNMGNAPLIISTVRSSDPCFCSDWPKEPLMPGKRGTFRIACPPMVHAGTRQQTYFVESNAGAPIQFRVKRVVLAAP